MTIYRVIRNGKESVYNYDRSRYKNNTSEYNHNYWVNNKDELIKKAKKRRILARLESIKNEQKAPGKRSSS